jgi:hypothetical protein
LIQNSTRQKNLKNMRLTSTSTGNKPEMVNTKEDEEYRLGLLQDAYFIQSQQSSLSQTQVESALGK